MGLFVEIVNDGTGEHDTGHYDVVVRINKRRLWSGRIEGHRRSDGWQILLAKVALAALDNMDASVAGNGPRTRL